eukprot:scpid81815/ scgid8679/ 
MEAAVDTLEAQFCKASADLGHVSRRLELSFSESLRAVSREELNPLSLLTRLDAVRNRMTDIAAERLALDQELQASSSALASLVSQNCQLVHALQATVGHEPMTVDGDMSLVCGMAGVTLSPRSPVASSDFASPSESVTSLSRDESVSSYDDMTSGSEVSSHMTSGSEVSGHHSQVTTETGGNQVHFASDPIASHNQRYSKAPTPASRRKGQPSTFMPLTEEEFMTVSTLVRRRAKLNDVNHVYEILFKHFKVENNKGPLSTQKLTAMGLAITGSTGQAKLKSLAALKLLHISKDNAVRMP